MNDAAQTARRMWTLFEPVHVISYFAAEAKDAFERAGLRGFWRGYFAGRAAPLGPVGSAPVIAAFCSFAPAMVTRALPAVWDMISPANALLVRQAGAVASLRRLLGLAARDPVPDQIGAAAWRLADAARDLDIVGRVLGASNSALPVPDEPLARLWHAATVLREHRGDGHIAAVVAAGLDGCESLALRAGVDRVKAARGNGQPGWAREHVQPMRGWNDAEWDAATSRLAERGLLETTKTSTTALSPATGAGLALHRSIEAATDLAAARPWARLGAQRLSELADLLAPVSSACAAVLPFPNPVGLPAPAVS
jgi:hypothetical protein